MSKVFVLDTNKQALDPVHPGRARLLLKQGKAAVYRRFPFTLMLKTTVSDPHLHSLRLKIDPGSRTTGLAAVNDGTGEVVWAAELTHRGEQIKADLDTRRAVRHSRRQRKTRYRKPRFQNRRRSDGWLPPSLFSRVENVLTWARRLMKLCPLVAITQEVVRFDLQKLEDPEICGVEYQQGELQGYEVREYLLAKWGRKCSYCGKEQVPLEIEHIQARASGGTNRVSNLCLACHACNQTKGMLDVRIFLADKPEVLACLLAISKSPLKDAAVVNSTRWALYDRLQTLGLPIEVGSGGRTKFNRTVRKLPKTHWLDAVCVGASTPEQIQAKGVMPLLITAIGHGCRRMCNINAFGFPCSKPKGAKRVKGFRTGDIVRAVVTTGKKRGRYVGRVLVRASGSFDIRTKQGRVQGISHRFCTSIHRCDGYSYAKGTVGEEWPDFGEL